MFRHSALALLALAWLVPAGAAEIAPSTLMEADEAAHWRGVGRINVTGPGWRVMCTGTLIRPDVVLTAAHCVQHPRNGAPLPPARINFVAGWHKGEMTGHRVARSVVVHPGYAELAGGEGPVLERFGADLALVHLDSPMTAEEAMPFAVDRPPLPDDPVLLVSYRRDRAHVLSRQDDCRYRAIAGNVLVLDCRVVGGASGAPVFYLRDGAPVVVAVLSASTAIARPQALAARVDAVLPTLIDMLE